MKGYFKVIKIINLIRNYFRIDKKDILYEDEYRQAIKRTERLKLKLPDIHFNNAPILNNQFHKEFYEIFNKYTFNIDEIILQCFEFNHKIKEILDKEFKHNFMYTIGYIELNGTPYFQESEESLLDMINEGRPNYREDGMKIHVWLTLPSMEIIDFTLPSTLSTKFPEIKKGSVSMKHADQFGILKYKPLLVGNDFFKKIGIF